MMELDLEARWPELFEQLDQAQRRTVVDSFVDGWHEGWEPTRQDVADLTELVAGAITKDEYRARALRAAGLDPVRAPYEAGRAAG